LRESVPAREQVEGEIAKLHKAFEKLRCAQFAIVKVDLSDDDDERDNLLLRQSFRDQHSP
jgi:hypothetical protein